MKFSFFFQEEISKYIGDLVSPNLYLLQVLGYDNYETDYTPVFYGKYGAHTYRYLLRSRVDKIVLNENMFKCVFFSVILVICNKAGIVVQVNFVF